MNSFKQWFNFRWQIAGAVIGVWCFGDGRSGQTCAIYAEGGWEVSRQRAWGSLLPACCCHRTHAPSLFPAHPDLQPSSIPLLACLKISYIKEWLIFMIWCTVFSLFLMFFEKWSPAYLKYKLFIHIYLHYKYCMFIKLLILVSNWRVRLTLS